MGPQIPHNEFVPHRAPTRGVLYKARQPRWAHTVVHSDSLHGFQGYLHRSELVAPLTVGSAGFPGQVFLPPPKLDLKSAMYRSDPLGSNRSMTSTGMSCRATARTTTTLPVRTSCRVLGRPGTRPAPLVEGWLLYLPAPPAAAAPSTPPIAAAARASAR